MQALTTSFITAFGLRQLIGAFILITRTKRTVVVCVVKGVSQYCK